MFEWIHGYRFAIGHRPVVDSRRCLHRSLLLHLRRGQQPRGICCFQITVALTFVHNLGLLVTVCKQVYTHIELC